ncbi:MAG: hypothetical protein ABI359_12840 [Ginsengibacter sp.]
MIVILCNTLTRMKNYLLFLLSLISTFAFAQSNPADLKSRIFDLTVKTIPASNLKLPFQSIKIIDARADTSIIGFRRLNNIAANRFNKITIKKGIQKGIEDFYNGYYQGNFTPNGKVLLISIRKLWINFLPREFSLPRKMRNPDLQSKQDIYARFEYYIGSDDKYLPMQRLDTVFQLTSKEDFNPDDESDLPYFCFTLENMIEKADYSFINELDEKKKMTFEDVAHYNEAANNLPVLKDAIKTGVFLTLDEFKNNQPSIKLFKTRTLKKRTFNEITDEKENVIHHYFAYFDGHDLFIYTAPLLTANHVTKNYSIAYRVGNSFQLYQSHTRTFPQRVNINTPQNSSSQTGLSSLAIPVIVPSKETFSIPGQLDLDTGEIF